MKRGHVPIRRCIACRQRRPAREMIRLKAADDTVVVVGSRETRSGRGCYICPEQECVKAALERGCLSRALRRSIATPPSKEALLKGQE